MKTQKNKLAITDIPVVILAAGEGSRLSNGNGNLPKPMALLKGLSLLEHLLITCKKAGISRFFVVIGFMRDEMDAYTQTLAEKYNLRIKAVQNNDWKEGNGTSVAACAPYLKGAFFIAMCDHILEPMMFEKLVASDSGDGFCHLAVDRRIDQVFDPEDATRVNLKGDLITEIGKDIKTYNGIDTGLFLCRPFLFDALSNSREEGDASLSGGVRKLTQAGKIKGVDIGNCFWLDVDTPESLRHGESVLSNLN
ncbi:MAG: NTP transferase domain-containing protein [Nitrospinae bacterium]|nr:NTP transferase domain-containing protein [Nitrospinota bacterium]